MNLGMQNPLCNHGPVEDQLEARAQEAERELAQLVDYRVEEKRKKLRLEIDRCRNALECLRAKP
jgi:hypothetical protein